MADNQSRQELERQSRELQRLIEEAERVKREITEHLQRLRTGGHGEHTTGKPSN